MKRGWDIGWKIGLGIGLLFGLLQSLAGQGGGGIGAILAGAAGIAIVFGIGGALVGGVWAAVARWIQPKSVLGKEQDGKDEEQPLARDETGFVRWALVMWFLVFVAAYSMLVGIVLTVMEPGTDRAVAILRAAGVPGIIVAVVGAKLMTRRRYQKPQPESKRA